MILSKADNSTGAMVALYPSPEAAQQLALDGGEPVGELHLTLAYLGKAAQVEDPERLAQVVQGVAATTPPLKGEIAGKGHFTAGPEPVTYASPDIPGLPTFHQRLIEALKGAGYEPATDHGFTPHITLAYEHVDPDVPNLPLEFGDVCLVLGGQRQSFPLTGKQAADDRSHVKISDAPWSGDAEKYDDDEWKRACIVDRGETYNTAKERYAVPVREPDGTLNRKGLASAAGALNDARGGVKAPPAALAAAKRELRRLYDQAGLPMASEKAEGVRELTGPLWKDDAQRIVYGVVMQPHVPDSQGDWQSPEDIEKAAHRYLAESRKHDVQHQEQAVDVVPVESFIAPTDMEYAGRPVLKGSWVMAVRVNDDEVWNQVTKGDLTGFSIGGTGERLDD